jgi:hypothetical protein
MLEAPAHDRLTNAKDARSCRCPESRVRLRDSIEQDKSGTRHDVSFHTPRSVRPESQPHAQTTSRCSAEPTDLWQLVTSVLDASRAIRKP